MKYRILSFISIIISMILAVLIVGDYKTTFQIEKIFNTTTTFIFQGIAFLNMILLFSGLCISTNQLFRNNCFWKTVRYFFSFTIITYSVTQLLAFLISKVSFLPSNQVPDISQLNNLASTFGLKIDTWNNIQEITGLFSWVLAFSHLSPNQYIIWFVFFAAIGFVMLYDMEVAEPSYNLADSINRLTFSLLQRIFSLLSVYLVIYVFYTVWQFSNNDLLMFYMGFILRLLVITAILFLFVPLVLFIIYKDQKAHLFFWKTFLSIFTSFLTGNAVFSMVTLILEQKNHFGIQRINTGLLNPLNIVFLRPGSAIVLAYSFVTYYSSNTRWQLSFFPDIFWTMLIPIGLAIIIGLFSIPNYYMVIPFYFILFGLGTTDTFVIMTPILLLSQSFACCIDLLSWNLSNYLYDRFYSDASKQ